jgi:ATP-binding cassette subfamily F protein uup
MQKSTTIAPAASSANSTAANSSATTSSVTVAKPKKLSFKEQRELEQLPQLIADLEAEQTSISTQLADASLYRQSPSEAQQLNQRYAEIDTLLVQALERWEEIESRSQAS